ncbi:MAG: alpha/beta hydrolase [Moraxellaceae bacterium]|nr:alpha/beta hydrolase [Moraxellaceae bacterium]
MTSSERLTDNTTIVRSGMASVNGGIEICYEERGPETGEPLLLIMGLGAQMLLWPEEFCDMLVHKGYRVIRMDNRDIGLSTKIKLKTPPMNDLVRMARFSLGLKSPSAYTLYDMARDAEGLLDHLGIREAHVVGASMGGMIAQILAGSSPARVKSLGIIFSSTNQPLLPPPHPEAIAPLMKGPGKGASTDELVAHSVKLFRVIGSPAYQEPPHEREAFARRLHERSYHPAGVKRQFTAVLSSGSLKPVARKITAPTVVIHGKEDRLVRPGCGKAVARAIRGAELHMIPGMGHDLPRALWPKLVHLIDSNAKRR